MNTEKICLMKHVPYYYTANTLGANLSYWFEDG